MSTEMADLKRAALGKRLAALQEEYAAANDQISSTLSAVDRLRLQRQAVALGREMAGIDNELAHLAAQPDRQNEHGARQDDRPREVEREEGQATAPEPSHLISPLREVLARTFIDRRMAELLAGDVGLSLADIDLSGAPVIFWQAILEEARRKGRVRILLDRALDTAPEVAELRALRDQFVLKCSPMRGEGF